MRRPISLLIAVLFCAGLAAPPAIGAPDAPTLPPLHAQGRKIVDNKGKPVRLRGVNIGGWLVTESWMCGQTNAPDDHHGGRQALEQLEKRFGPDKAAALMSAWQDNWMTAADLDAIQKYGCNLLRVPFSYRTLQDAAGKWKRDARGTIDFSRMDWIVREAGRRGMYVIFVLHTWPGDYNTVSRDTPVGKAQRAQVAQLWAEVARHYRGAGTVAAFDVMNEPEGSPGNVLQKAMYDAIRAQDGQRMLVFESVGYAGIAKERWTNIVWSAHYPENAQKFGTARERIEAFDREQKLTATPAVQVPIFIGECKAPQDSADSAAELAAAFNDRGWHWAVWTYKGVDNGGWASVNYDRALKYDLSADPYDAILEKWTKGLSEWERYPSKRSNLHRTDWWIDGFGREFEG